MEQPSRLAPVSRAGIGTGKLFALCLAVTGMVCTLWQAVWAQQTPADVEPQVFRYQFTPNSQHKYRMRAEMSGVLPLLGGMPVEKVLVQITMALKVRNVRPDGNAEVSLDVEAFKAEMDGQTLPLPLERLRTGMRDMVYVINPQGEVVERKGTVQMPFNIPLPGVEPSQLPLMLFQLVFPRDAVTAGQEWTYNRPMTTTPGDAPAQFTARWAKDEAVSSVPASLFTQKMRWNRAFKADIFDMPTTDPSVTVKQIDQTVSAEAQIWFNREQGRLVRANLTAQYEQQTRLLNASETGSAPAPVRLTAKIQILREELAPRENETRPNGT